MSYLATQQVDEAKRLQFYARFPPARRHRRLAVVRLTGSQRLHIRFTAG
jgi:hypothetical protein